MAEGDFARDDVRRHLRRVFIEKAVAHWIADEERETGARPLAEAIQTFKRGVEADPDTDAQVDRALDDVAGIARREGFLDVLAILLWGTSGSLVAALVWEHRLVVPSVLVVALVGAATIQFRGAIRRSPRRSALYGAVALGTLISVGLLYGYRERIGRVTSGAVCPPVSGTPPSVGK